ncbi:nitroreductase family protein [Anoxybacillus ayderensis]|uniref:nitroreductase family protein n=1 Tax=Anoxybacillus TaxID=150247 RepID=UPI0002DF0D4F|nr:MULTISPECIES: nitroreductase family protein [Anoxybacillus]AXM88095.1 nitroreductase family protein [Anoxybacillus ayderensis G10]KHF27015.1 putative NAD(P)H nitroreductase YodC [Anoxybacillus sp. BCO1]THD15642.1 nitroreductase family protein [Anoxybacillus ayderensis]MBW9217241.1 nitroreductase family protein [Anoxybacillus sp. ST70]MCQ5364829.1 nitroreductase family protein [Anoxybacillus gonensis]
MISIMEQRQSIRKYDPNASISKEQLTKILQLATKAPSAWNLQHWHFVVIYGKEAQQKLLPIAYNQQQIVDASAVVAVLGDLQANKKTDAVYDPLVAQGKMTKEVKETLAKQIEQAYTNAQYARDAAFTNASLAAMQLMLAAKAEGFDTCAIGGFDPQAFMKEFHISDRYIPVMLITIGKASAPAHPSLRLPVDEVTTWVE